MLGCGRRGHPAVTHKPPHPWDGCPQPDGGGRSHQEQPCEEGVGDNLSPCQVPHLLARLGHHQSQQLGEEEVTPWCAFELGASKTITVPPAAQPTRVCTPSFSAPFRQASQSTQQREGPSASAAAGEHLSIHLSREWVKQPVPHPSRPAWASRHGRERLTAGAHYQAAIKRVEALPPTLIRRALQLCALEPRDAVQGLFITSYETGVLSTPKRKLADPTKKLCYTLPKVRGLLDDHVVCFG